MRIQIYREKKYHKMIQWYIVDQQQKDAVRIITRNTTVTDRIRKGLEMLGFNFEIVENPSLNKINIERKEDR